MTAQPPRHGGRTRAPRSSSSSSASGRTCWGFTSVGTASGLPAGRPFTLLFGLSMDDLGLGSSHAGGVAAHGNNAAAVTTAIARTARQISAAAAIMVIVFGSFLVADSSSSSSSGSRSGGRRTARRDRGPARARACGDGAGEPSQLVVAGSAGPPARTARPSAGPPCLSRRQSVRAPTRGRRHRGADRRSEGCNRSPYLRASLRPLNSTTRPCGTNPRPSRGRTREGAPNAPHCTDVDRRSTHPPGQRARLLPQPGITADLRGRAGRDHALL